MKNLGRVAFLLTLITSVVVPSAAQAARTCLGKPATIVASRLSTYGTPGADVIVGTFRSEFIYARAGNDLVCAGGGEDFVSGGRGADRLAGGYGGDVVQGGRGNDYLFGGRDYDNLWGGLGDDVFHAGGESAAVMFLNAPGPVTVNLITNRATGEGTDAVNDGIEGVWGSAYGDTVIGDSDTEEIYGGSGNDKLSIQVVGRGVDVYGEDGDDTLRVDDGEALDKADGGNDTDECSADAGDIVVNCTGALSSSNRA